MRRFGGDGFGGVGGNRGSCGVVVRVALMLVVIAAICIFVFDLGTPYLADKSILLKNFFANVETIELDDQASTKDAEGAAEQQKQDKSQTSTSVVSTATNIILSTIVPLSSSGPASKPSQECWKHVPVYNGLNCLCYFEVIGFAKCGSTFVDSMMHQIPEVRSSRFRAAKVLPHFVSRVSKQQDYNVTCLFSLSFFLFFHIRSTQSPSLIFGEIVLLRVPIQSVNQCDRKEERLDGQRVPIVCVQ